MAPWFCLGLVAVAADAPKQEALEFFEQKIRPVLVERCYSCHSHSGEKLKANLFLDNRAEILKGGDTGPALNPGHPEKSLLVEAIEYTNPDLQMPPKTRLSPEQVHDFREWVRLGAPWPEETVKSTRHPSFDLQQRKASHWCWKPITSPTPPTVANSEWPAVPLDRFILDRLQKSALSPAPKASRESLLRRVTFDLIGLPPTPSELDAFLADTSSTAWTTVVDRLLASSQFGERWARHWLDLVRYAESRGHEFDPTIPNAWQYRDYVIRSLNQDVRYDQWVREHLAGDLIPPRLNPTTGANESILGTGFWFLGEEVHSPVDIRQDEADRIDNRLDVAGKAFLGLTLGCARCHDHKFDAISQRDYYAMTGFLVSSGYRQVRFESLEVHRQIASELGPIEEQIRPRLVAAVMKAENDRLDHLRQIIRQAEALRESTVPLNDPAWSGDQSQSVIAWIRELKSIRDDPRHPLSTILSASKELPSHTSEPAPGDVQTVCDFSATPRPCWMQDGYSFGSHPMLAGEAILGTTPDHPIAGISSLPAAWHQPFWAPLSLDGVERDSGRIGEWDRSERTLRSPEFRLAHGKLRFLVRGSGRAYACVDSHLLIVGPLHGALLDEWHTPNDRWTWVEQNLDGYVGHRLHVEFSPVGKERMAVAQVISSETAPTLPPSDIPLDWISAGGSAEERITSALSHVCEALRSGSFEASPSCFTASQWDLADWMVQNIDLLCPEGSSERQHLKLEAEKWLEPQTRLAQRIRAHSATAPAMFEGSGMDEAILIRGSSKRPGDVVPRRFLEALAAAPAELIPSGSGRLQLSTQVADSNNPLTSRVLVNRVWHHLFGRGLVATVDNFGVLGDAPTHPELLDYLAHRFTHEQGWSIKQLIREMVLSSTYQMSSRPSNATSEEADPQNLLLHRMNVRRLEGEAIRDALLAVSGRLDLKTAGPPVPVHLTDFMEGRGRPDHSGPLDGDGRRSIYQAVRRNFLNPMMLAFDSPIPFNAMGRRNQSNVPAQALILMNDPFVVEQAAQWARHSSTATNPTERIRSMYRMAFSRLPSPAEIASATSFLETQAATYEGAGLQDPRVWADLGHVLFNVKEFIYLN